MPILFIGTGLILILTAVKGNASTLYNLVVGDFSGPNSFVYWLLSIVVLGALGYIKGLENLSKLFLILVLIVLFLDNGGFFSKFQAFASQVQAQPAPAKSAQTQTAQAPSNPS